MSCLPPPHSRLSSTCPLHSPHLICRLDCHSSFHEVLPRLPREALCSSPAHLSCSLKLEAPGCTLSPLVMCRAPRSPWASQGFPWSWRSNSEYCWHARGTSVFLLVSPFRLIFCQHRPSPMEAPGRQNQVPFPPGARSCLDAQNVAMSNRALVITG